MYIFKYEASYEEEPEVNIHKSSKNSCFERFGNIFSKKSCFETPLTAFSCCFFRIAKFLI